MKLHRLLSLVLLTPALYTLCETSRVAAQPALPSTAQELYQALENQPLPRLSLTDIRTAQLRCQSLDAGVPVLGYAIVINRELQEGDQSGAFDTLTITRLAVEEYCPWHRAEFERVFMEGQ